MIKDPTFDAVAEKMEQERQERALKEMRVDPDRIQTIKALKPYLCDDCAPPYHKGAPRVNACKLCVSQCGYGKRLIELVKEVNVRKKPETDEPQEEEREKHGGRICVLMTPAECRSAYRFIEEHLIGAIRENKGADIEWIEEMIGAMKALKEADW